MNPREASEQDLLNIKLGASYQTIKNEDLSEINKLIQEGADPLAIVLDTDLLSQALLANNPAILTKIVEVAGKRIDFKRSPFYRDDSKGTKVNMLQYAAMVCSEESFAVFANCAKSQGHSVKDLLNAPVYLQADSASHRIKTRFASYLLRHLDLALILNNLIVSDNPDSDDYHIRVGGCLSEWGLRSGAQPFNVHKYLKNGEGLEIVWSGPEDTIETLAKYGLDLNAAGCDGLPPVSIAQDLNKHFEKDTPEKKILSWKPTSSKLLCNLTSVKIDEDSYAVDKDGLLSVVGTFDNLVGAHPLKIKITFDFRKLKEKIEEEIALQKSRGIADEDNAKRDEQIAQLVKSKEQHSDRLRANSDEREKSDEAYKRHIPNDPHQAEIYKIIAISLSERIKTERQKRGQAIETKVTAKGAHNRAHATDFFRILGSLAPLPIGKDAINLGIEKMGKNAVEGAQKIHDKATEQKLNHMDLDLNPGKLVVAVATVISEDKSLTIDEANKISDGILKQFNQIGDKFEGSTMEDLVKFLCSPAYQKKSAVLAFNNNDTSRKHSDPDSDDSASTSATNSSGEGKPASKKGPGQKKGGCIVS